MCRPLESYEEKGPEKELHMKGLTDGKDPPINLFDSIHWREACLVVRIRAIVECQKGTHVHYGAGAVSSSQTALDETARYWINSTSGLNE
jgi:hypothetical protein